MIQVVDGQWLERSGGSGKRAKTVLTYAGEVEIDKLGRVCGPAAVLAFSWALSVQAALTGCALIAAVALAALPNYWPWYSALTIAVLSLWPTRWRLLQIFAITAGSRVAAPYGYLFVLGLVDSDRSARPSTLWGIDIPVLVCARWPAWASCVTRSTARAWRMDPMADVRRFDHIGITVADLDAATGFFVGLGLEVEGRMFVEGEFLDTVIGMADSRTEIVMLRPSHGGTGLELSSFVRPDHEPGVSDRDDQRAWPS